MSFKFGSAFCCSWIILGDGSIYACDLICLQSAPNIGSGMRRPFSSIFLASGFPCSQTESTSAPAPCSANANR
jgi:hypothetical protein